MKYKISSPQWNKDGGINVVWDHPDFGPIPFTCVNGNLEKHSDEPEYMADIWEGLMRGDFGPIAPMESVQ